MCAWRVDDPDMPVAEIMRRWPETIAVFLGHQMLCVGCVIGPFHTLDDVAQEYRLDRDDLLAELVAAIARRQARAWDSSTS